MMLHKLKEGIKGYYQIIDSDYKRYDTWSYLAIVLEIFSDVKHVETINTADFKDFARLQKNIFLLFYILREYVSERKTMGSNLFLFTKI